MIGSAVLTTFLIIAIYKLGGPNAILSLLVTTPAETLALQALDLKPNHHNIRKSANGVPYPPGLYNTGNLCFMNSVTQALVSLPSLLTYLQQRYSQFRENPYDDEGNRINLLVTEALLGLTFALNELKPSRRAIQPSILMRAISAGRTNILAYEQQDAHELFQLVSSALSEEEASIARVLIRNPTFIGSEWDALVNQSRTTKTITAAEKNIDAPSKEPLSSSKSKDSDQQDSVKQFAKPETGSDRTLPQANGHHPANGSVNGKVNGHNVDDRQTTDDVKNVADRASKSLFLSSLKQGFDFGLRNPFVGLVASSVVCLQCGFTSGIQHQQFDNFSLALPTRYHSVTIESLLKTYTAPERLEDWMCEKCSMVATLQECTNVCEKARARVESIKSDIAELQRQPEKTEGTEKKMEKYKRNMREALTVLVQVEKELDAVKESVQEEDETKLPETVKRLKIPSKSAAKQVLIARPPKCLALHMQRSIYLPSGSVMKNTTSVAFQCELDLTPFCTSSGFAGGCEFAGLQTFGKPWVEPNEEQEEEPVETIEHDDSRIPELKEESPDVNIQENDVHDDDEPLDDDRSRETRVVEDAIEEVLVNDTIDASGGDDDNNVDTPAPAKHVESEQSDPDAETAKDAPPPPIPDNPPSTEPNNSNNPYIYALKAVVLHYGGHDSGHFVTYRRTHEVDGTETHKWFRISDDRVDLVSDIQDEIFSYASGSVYMLFYEQGRWGSARIQAESKADGWGD
ncbi:hypothetical protein SmJEL517_g01864 [Synchytrium microbalum]|uniref:ubiquitinyl hydrolase 1 n=1 Tax=Synchytrium microbalum TaxID=1806994 RepID=A0A507CCQ6_9FUNG|nr:uncharacterized protein SmJEL517_g01864 [Synchytrium microbalum]TPX35704.1 hypothetical protein SmJEL517_g01864 [Synchytrium microbalum]